MDISEELEQKQLEKVKKNWQPENGNLYYYIHSTGKVVWTNFFKNCHSDNLRVACGNCFKTEEEANQYLTNLKTRAKLKALAEELNGNEIIDWKNNNQFKYFIMYDCILDDIYQNGTDSLRSQGTIYCLDSDFMEKAVQSIGEQKLIDMIRSDA